jgi:hypothetical protein
LSSPELSALAEAVELYEKILDVLGRVEAYPRDHVLHVETEIQPGYLGWIGYDESGTVTFQPAPKEANE